MSVESHKDTVRRLYQALERGEADVADEVFTDDFVTSEGEHQNVTGTQSFKEAVRDVHATHGDPRFEILDILGEDDRVMVYWRMRARHSGTILDFPATGEEITMEAFALFRFVGERISQRHAVLDRLGLFQQLQAAAAAA